MINTVNCQRKNPFTSGNSNYNSFKLLLLLVPIVFGYSVNTIWRQTNDLSGYCVAPAEVNGRMLTDVVGVQGMADQVLPQVIGEVEDDLVHLFHSLTKMNYLGEIDDAVRNFECKTYSAVQVFNYNFFIWCFSFFWFGLQFTHADVGFMQNLTLDPATMATWGPGMWTVFFILFGLIGVVLLDVLYHYLVIGILRYYAIWAIALFSAIVWQSRRVAPERKIHVHHYFLALVIMSFLSY